MLIVRDVMRAGPLTLEPEESLRAAVDVLIASGSGGAPVVSGDRLVGVVSLSDILAFEAEVPELAMYGGDGAGGATPEDGRYLPEDADTDAAWHTDNWELDGFRFPSFVQAEWEALEEHSVAEVMTRTVISVPPGMPIREAAEIMDRAGVHRLVVTEDGALVGVLSARDIVHAVARGEIVPAPEFDR